MNADKIIFVSQDAVHALNALKPAINTKAQFYGVGRNRNCLRFRGRRLPHPMDDFEAVVPRGTGAMRPDA